MADNIENELRQRMIMTQALLARLFFETQLKESDKTPGLWSVYTGTITPSNTGQQSAQSMLGKNNNRSGLTVKNLGPGVLLYSSESFNVYQAQQQADSMNGIFRIGVLTKGTSITIPTSGPIYGACKTTTNCRISIVETMFRVRTKRNEAPGEAGNLYHQYRSVHGEIETLVKEFT